VKSNGICSSSEQLVGCRNLALPIAKALDQGPHQSRAHVGFGDKRCRKQLADVAIDVVDAVLRCAIANFRLGVAFTPQQPTKHALPKGRRAAQLAPRYCLAQSRRRIRIGSPR
jgi:hypothetical protein